MEGKRIKVVLSGAGALYPLHVGALRYLAEQGFIIEHITGVSGGAIIAAAVASGYAPGDELEAMILDMLPGPKKLVDWSWTPWWDWGIIKGDRMLKAMEEVFVPKMEDAVVPCNIGAVDLDGPGNFGLHHMIYSTEGTPEVSLAAAVRASISIPFVFKPAMVDGRRHIDGGVASNFPLDIYGTGEGVVGFRVRPLGSTKPPKSLFEYGGIVLQIMMEAVAREHIEDAVFARMVQLRSSANSLDFHMGPDTAKALIEHGYQQAQASLKDHLDSLGV